MDCNGARPKEKRATRRTHGDYMEGQNMDDHCPSEEGSSHFVRHLSVRMCDVLDRVGASAEFRKLQQDCALSCEIVRSLDDQLTIPFSRFTFGSSCEGTTTPGMNSDTDMLICQDNIPVVDNISDAGDGHYLLMIRDKNTQPGYVKLQHVFNGLPQTGYKRNIDRDEYEFDSAGRICLKHISMLGKDDIVYERNGPADTNSVSNFDAVHSFRCSRILEFSTEWTVRKRLYGWPSKQMLDKMVKMGCFVVGVGHPASKESNIEWRLSFSLQERELMFSMNMVQHKCYILLKLIKKDIIEPAIGKSMSSYHLKTCMLYVVENTKAKLWKRSNLVQCVIMCLHVLLKWVHEEYCPNYFIKEENMFDRDIHRTQRTNLVEHLIRLLSNGCDFLFHIKLDCIGDILKRVKKTDKIEYDVSEAYCRIKTHTAIDSIRYKAHLCWTLNVSQTPLQSLQYLRTLHLYILTTNCIQDHTDEQTQEAFSYIKPFVHLQLAQSYASLAFKTDEFGVKYRLLQSCKYHLDQGRQSDMTSSRLLEVTILLKLEQYEQCVLILDQLKQNYNRKLLLRYPCDYHFPVYINKDHVQEFKNLTIASILRRSSMCVMFQRSDMVIIPEAIQYEVYRSVGTPGLFRHEDFDRWMDLAIVDAVVYLHFMKYLLHAKHNQVLHTHLAINKLELILKQKQYLDHRETGYNLLGWIHFREGRLRQGIEYLRKSWSIRPHHNAAKFHIMFYIFGDGNYQ